MKTEKTQYDFPPIGCYFDGANGQDYNDKRAVELANSYGAKIEWDSEHSYDCAREAEDYLNSLETRPFLFWQWNDGDFGLYPNVDGAREDCGFVSHSDHNHTDECDPDDAAYPNADYRGEWLHVSDHGNCTLYIRQDDGTDTEVWSVV